MNADEIKRTNEFIADDSEAEMTQPHPGELPVDFSIDSDQRCRAMKQNVPVAIRCERKKGHDGLHTFEGSYE